MSKKYETASYHEILALVAEETGKSKAQTYEFYRSFHKNLVEVLKTKDVALPRLVKFEHVDRAARDGRNPSTGEAIKIPAKTVIKPRVKKDIYDLQSESK